MKKTKKIGVAYEGDRVKMLTITGKPIGVVTKEYYEHNDSLSRQLRWVRLKDGVLLKDVSENEIQFLKFVEIPI